MKSIYGMAALAMIMTVSAGGSAQAGDSVTLGGWNGPLGMFGRYDSDQDGRVSAAEYRSARMAQFDRMDKNGDGTLSRREIEAVGRHTGSEPSAAQASIDKRIEVLKAADADGDGKLSREEYGVSCDTDFAGFDRDGDGFISAGDVAAINS